MGRIWTLLFVSFVAIQGFSKNLSIEEKRQKVMVMYSKYSRSFKGVRALSPEQAIKQLQSDDVVFLDVREKKEQEVSMIPGAITKEQFEKAKTKYKDKKVVTYCTVGYRSGKYAQELLKTHKNVQNLEGSLLLWSLYDGPLVNQKGPTKKLHVYGSQWNYVGNGYEPVW